MTAPVLWWKGENDAVDSQTGLTGTWSGTAAYTTGVVNNAFSFNGSSVITVPNNALFDFNPTDAFSVRCYFKTADWADTRVIVKDGLGGSQNNWYISVFAQRIYIAYGGLSFSTGVLTDLQINTWYDLLVTYNAGAWEIFFNGASVYTKTQQFTKNYNNPVLYIGGLNPTQGRLTGAIDELRIYNAIIGLDNSDVTVTPVNAKARLAEGKISMGFKLEATPYTAETLTVDNYKYSVYNVKVSVDVEEHAQTVSKGDFSKWPAIAGKRYCGVNFTVDVYGLATSATPPSYFEILRACGWKQTVHGSSGVSIKPDPTYDRVPATIEICYEDDYVEACQLVFKMVGAMGNAKLIGVVGEPLHIEFSFLGALDRIYTRAYANRIAATGFDSGTPEPLQNVRSCIWMNRTTFIEKFEIDCNTVVNVFTNVFKRHGHDGAHVVDRVITGKFTVGGYMALVVWQMGGVVAIGHDASTGERGFLVKVVNRTGETSVKGTLVARSTSADNEVIKQSNEYDTVGIIAEAGVAQGSEMWIWKNGSICQVLFKDSTVATRGNMLIADAVDGRASDITNPGSGLPATDTHFKECGHVCESKSGGTNILVLADIHFN